MAKNMKKVTEIVLKADETGLAYGKCEIIYIVGSTDDPDLSKPIIKEFTLTGQDLTDAQAMYNLGKSLAETEEGI